MGLSHSLPTPFSFIVSQLSIPPFSEQLDGGWANLEKLSLRDPASPCSSVFIPSSRARADITCLHVCMPQKCAAYLFVAGEDVPKESSSKRLEETSLVRAKHAVLCFNGGPAWFPRPPSATRWQPFKPCCHCCGA